MLISCIYRLHTPKNLKIKGGIYNHAVMKMQYHLGMNNIRVHYKRVHIIQYVALVCVCVCVLANELCV